MWPPRDYRSPARSRADLILPPEIGEHTVEILREAGLDQAEIDRLLREGVVVQAKEAG